MQFQNDPQLEPAGALYYFKKALEVVKLNRLAMAEVARDENAIRFGLVVTAAGGALAMLPHAGLAGILVSGLYSLAALFLFAGFVHLFAGYSKGKEEFVGFVRIVALTGIIDWLAVIPMAGLFAAIWSLVVAILAAQEVYQMAGGKATICILFAASALWIISLILFAGPLGFLYDMPGS